LHKKIWIRLFCQMAAIFVVFVLLLTAANSAFLYKFFLASEKRSLVRTARLIENTGLSDEEALTKALESSEGQLNFMIEIRSAQGEILYTTFGQQIWNLHDKPDMFRPDLRRKYRTLEEENFAEGTLSTVTDIGTNAEYLMYTVIYSDGNTAEIRVQKQIMKNSAAIASQFVIILAFICLALSLLWILFYTRRFSRPITEMNEIAKDMADLKFDRKVRSSGSDEIGQLAVSINELSEKLDTTLGDLRQANAQLRDEIELERQIDTMRKTFIANVSHELKTPISIIQGYAEGLKLGVSDNPGEYCDVIMEESGRMNRMVYSLLELSQYESGQMKIQKERFDLGDMVFSLCRKMQKRAAESDAELRFETDRPVMVLADADRVEQVVSNYLNNALSHVAKGGRITVSIHPRPDAVRVEVYNTGAQIPEEEIGALWQSFYRGDRSRKREESRFGLGLSIVRSIMELHGRPYGVYNMADGVCFWFELEPADQPPTPEAGNPPAGGTKA
jgi:two-component system sensor histidine kinase VanS